MGFPQRIVQGQNFKCLVSLQKWPWVDISLVESLLVVFAYEKCTGEMVTVEKIQNGSLGPKLTQEDFDTALQVTDTHLLVLFMKNKVWMCNSCLTCFSCDQLDPQLNMTTCNTTLLLQCVLLPKVNRFLFYALGAFYTVPQFFPGDFSIAHSIYILVCIFL